MSSQKALLLHSANAGKFELGARSIPSPGPGQLLIKIKSAALNPVDNFIQSIGYLVRDHGFPAVPGSDGAGTVEAVGESVSGFSAGDRVLFQCWWTADRGTLQQYALSDAVRTCKLPAGLSFDEAATIPLGLGTAATGLYAAVKDGFEGPGGGIGLTAPWKEGGKGKYSGKPILILGGSSSVGQFAIQLASLSGFEPIITTASTHNADYCKKAGATHIIDYQETPYAELSTTVSKITTQPVEIVYDAVTKKDSVSAGLRVLASGGDMVVTLPQEVAKPGSRGSENKLVVFCYGNLNAEINQAFGAEMYSKLPALLEDGSIKPNAIDVLPDGLLGTFGGLERLASGKVSGAKLIVHPQDTA